MDKIFTSCYEDRGYQEVRLIVGFFDSCRLSGLLDDQLIFKRDRAGRTIVSREPNFENRVFSANQKKHQSKFQEAAAYAKVAAKIESIYKKLDGRYTDFSGKNYVTEWRHGAQSLKKNNPPPQRHILGRGVDPSFGP